MLVLGKQRDNLMSPSNLLKQEKYRYRTSSELENSVLEINHVTNVTTVLNETTASFRTRKLCSRNQPCHERDHISKRDRSLRLDFSLIVQNFVGYIRSFLNLEFVPVFLLSTQF